MKLFIVNLIMLGLGFTVMSAQTINHGNGIVSIQNGNSYKLTRNQKSENGGTVTMTFSGNLKDGKKDGVWKLTSNYNNYGGGNGYFFTGTSTMTRTYKDGILNGDYKLTQNVKYRTGSYNMVRGVWKYGPYEDGTEQVSGSFLDGKPTGKWNIKAPLLICSIQFKNGIPDGDVSVSDPAMGGGVHMSFRDGYLVKWEPWNNKRVREGLKWSEDENLENLPSQEEGDLFYEISFLSYFMGGSDLEKWVKNYPMDSSNEKFNIRYKYADKENHKALFGSPTKEELEAFERAMSDKKEKAKNLETAIKIREKINGTINPLIEKWKKENPTFYVHTQYWELQALKEATTLEEIQSIAPNLRGREENNIIEAFENEKKYTDEFNHRMSEINQRLKDYGYTEIEIPIYIKENIISKERNGRELWGMCKIDYSKAISRCVEHRKESYKKLADESPITLEDYKFYYNWNQFNKDNIVKADELKKWRKQLLLEAFAYTKAPLVLDYTVLADYIIPANQKTNVKINNKNIISYQEMDVYIPKVVYSSKKNAFRLVDFSSYYSEKDREKMTKSIIKKNPQFKKKK